MSGELTPILVGIKFLDTFLNFGQGIMTFAIFGLESQYVFSPLLHWIEKARSIWTNPDSQRPIKENDENERINFVLKLVQMLARKKFTFFQNKEKQGQKKKRLTPKISDALQAPEHVMLNFCQY